MSPWTLLPWLHTLRPRQNGCHFTDDTFKCISLNENAWISLKISLKFVPKVRMNNIPALVQIMAWRWPGEKPLSEAMIVRLWMHICITRPEWVNAKEMYISIADTLELRLFCIKPLTNPPNVPKFQEHVPDTFCQNPDFFLPFPLFYISIPSTWQKFFSELFLKLDFSALVALHWFSAVTSPCVGNFQH